MVCTTAALFSCSVLIGRSALRLKCANLSQLAYSETHLPLKHKQESCEPSHTALKAWDGQTGLQLGAKELLLSPVLSAVDCLAQICFSTDNCLLRAGQSARQELDMRVH